MRRIVPLLLATLLTTACVAWVPLENAGTYVDSAHPEQVRVTLTNGDQVIVLQPTVADSQIVGSVENGSGWTRVQFPMSQVRLVELQTSRPPSSTEVTWLALGAAVIFAITKLL